MSGHIADLFYDDNRAKFRWLLGNETFYDDKDRLIEFDTSIEAINWIKKEHPELTLRIAQGEQMTLGLRRQRDDKGKTSS
ncbi:MAG: hypothetical protein ACYTFW_00225 [Planctomycetota bacterium]|jgi:hypothetical protein